MSLHRGNAPAGLTVAQPLGEGGQGNGPCPGKGTARIEREGYAAQRIGIGCAIGMGCGMRSCIMPCLDMSLLIPPE